MFFSFSVSALNAAVSVIHMASFITMKTAAKGDKHSSKTKEGFMMSILVECLELY